MKYHGYFCLEIGNTAVISAHYQLPLSSVFVNLHLKYI